MLDVALWVVVTLLFLAGFLICPIWCACCRYPKSAGAGSGSTPADMTLKSEEALDRGDPEAGYAMVNNSPTAPSGSCCERTKAGWSREIRPSDSKWWIRVGVALVASMIFAYLVLLVIIASYVAAFQNSLTFEPLSSESCSGGTGHYDCDYTSPNPVFGVAHTSVVFTTEDGTQLDGFMMSNLTMPFAGAPMIRLLYNHGSGSNIAANYRMERYAFLLSLGNIQIMTYDYAGYGASFGSASFDSVKASAAAAFTEFESRVGGTPADYTFLGRSLGGGVASWLVSDPARRPGKLILQSTFANQKETAGNGFPMTAWLIEMVYGINFDSEENLRNFDGCYYQSHSVDDEVVPYEDGRQLYDSVKDHIDTPCSQFLRVEGPKHDDALTMEEKDALRTFLERD